MPRFLVEPKAVIVEAVATADPALLATVVATAVERVADTRAKRRRLAQALAADPALLTSGRPEGPRLIELLVRELLPYGPTRLVLPRCAGCGRQNVLDRVDGLRRICSPCANKAADRGRQSCAVCGRVRQVAGRDPDGRPRCGRHRPEPVDGHAAVRRLLERAGTGLDEDELAAVVTEVLPRPAQQQAVLRELTGRPDLLSGQGAHGSPRMVALITALAGRGARNVTVPACPFCRRIVSLRFGRDGARCCRRCYEQPRHQPCSSCGTSSPVMTRTPDGEPLCAPCARRDPVNHEPCTRCGRVALTYRDATGRPVCGRCQRPPVAVCSLCRVSKPCHYADTDAPRCANCTRSNNRTACSNCGRHRIVHARAADGGPLCSNCSRRRELCSACSTVRPVYARTTDGRALCKICYPKDPISFRHCTACGSLERLHHHGLCPACAAQHQLRTLLAGPDGQVHPRHEPIAAALLAGPPSSFLLWLRHPSSQELVVRLCESTEPLTHAALDAMRPLKAVSHLRAALSAHGVLPRRDEHLAAFERWLPETVAAIGDPDERALIRSFATWFHLNKLRRRSRRRPLTYGQFQTARGDVRAAIRLLAWLREHGSSLASCTQADIDRWLTSDQPGRLLVRNFLIWSARRGHCRPLAVPGRRSSRGQGALADAHLRWSISRRLLHDTALATGDRVAGCLVLLYGQSVSRITHLTTEHVHDDGRTVHLSLGARPLEVPDPLAGLVRELVRTRRGYGALGHTDDHRWLFPGVRAGRPISAQRQAARLYELGIKTRAGRSTALLELAAELPASVLSDLLGISIRTATGWSQEAGNTRPSYAAEVSRRATRAARSFGEVRKQSQDG
ncbi:hypothetical protein GCM10009759_71020 [Kitasatospora saccharophila]|uniref:Site-specific recombinase XerD n=1 Tax=Kitasatospora saccharophila TaxID=407973 RepID=A0ABP5JQQ5_9ACTN